VGILAAIANMILAMSRALKSTRYCLLLKLIQYQAFLFFARSTFAAWRRTS